MPNLKHTVIYITALLLGAACAPLEPESDPPAPVPAVESGEIAEEFEGPGEARGKYVVIDLDDNELRYMDGGRLLWRGEVGTGTGLLLLDDDSGHEWEFSTPRGIFYIQYKKLNPDWILPDWHFVKHDLPIPPRNSPERRIPGGLGRAAVYISPEIAIHGTNAPELLGQRVSHGCIRLSNENALRLFHNVQVGTPVVITGGEHLAAMHPDSVAVPSDPGGPKEPYQNPFDGIETAELLELLDFQITQAADFPAWTSTAGELISRGLEDDADALRGLLARAGSGPDESFEREYATFLADAFSRGTRRAIVSLARIGEEEREEAARAIVEATMDMYPGSLDDARAPWPSHRLAPPRLGPLGSAGWDALREAEEVYRSKYAGSRIVLGSGPA